MVSKVTYNGKEYFGIIENVENLSEENKKVIYDKFDLDPEKVNVIAFLYNDENMSQFEKCLILTNPYPVSMKSEGIDEKSEDKTYTLNWKVPSFMENSKIGQISQMLQRWVEGLQEPGIDDESHSPEIQETMTATEITGRLSPSLRYLEGLGFNPSNSEESKKWIESRNQDIERMIRDHQFESFPTDENK